jgi:hypothetical protein
VPPAPTNRRIVVTAGHALLLEHAAVAQREIGPTEAAQEPGIRTLGSPDALDDAPATAPCELAPQTGHLGRVAPPERSTQKSVARPARCTYGPAMHFPDRSPRVLLLTAGAIALVAAPGAVAAAPPPSPATGHSAVVAQANIEFTDAAYQWAVSSEALDPAAAPAPAVAGVDTFFAVTAGAVVAADATTPIARVAAGEAVFVANDATTTLSAADGAAANFDRIALTIGGQGGTGDPFTPGPGVRDVDLVRDVLEAGGTLTIADSEAAPALVVVASGGVTVAGDPAGSADVTPGAPDTFDGALTISNGGTDPAVVLVAVVGTLVQPTGSGPQPTGAPTDGGGPTEPGAPDADGDGLSDADEAAHGTDPNDPDSDSDDLSDGEEVHRYGTDPLSSRTDFDHLEDGLEIERGTDPLDEDTDDDGCQDSSDDNPLTGDGDCDGDTLSFDQEQQLGTDPANPDTDGDGRDDDMDPNPLSPDEGTPEPPAPPPATDPPEEPAPPGTGA